MRRSTSSVLAASLGLALTAGCSGTDAPGSPPPAAVCEAPGYASGYAPITIEQVSAELVDPEGNAVLNLPVQVCGLDKCFNGSSKAGGKVNMAPRSALDLPAFKYGDGFDFAELALPLGPEPRQDLGRLLAVPLPPLANGSAFPRSGAVAQGGVTLFIDEGSTVSHDVLTYAEAERRFRSVQIPLAGSERALDPQFGFELAHGVAPLGTTFCPPARFSVANSEAWSKGTEVEVFVQGLDVAQQWAPYGSWVKVADASVTEDERSIASTSGGIPILSAIALRRK